MLSSTASTWGQAPCICFLRKEQSRRIALNAIGPVWDGNEVWLVIGGGRFVCGFPLVYGTCCRCFTYRLSSCLVAIIFRAISIEFRSKEEMKWWRQTWDVCYCLSSISIALLLGLILGNLIQGIPLDAKTTSLSGRLRDFFNPYALLIAVTVLSLFMMHGAMYLAMKTEDRLFTRMTIIDQPDQQVFHSVFHDYLDGHADLCAAHDGYLQELSGVFALPIVAVLIVLNIRRSIEKRQYRRGSYPSAITTALLLILFAMGLYPNLVLSSIDPRGHISIYEAASSDGSLRTMLLFAFIGMPLVGTYTVFMFWTFRGKVKLEEHSY